jgi:hypothetical protein
MTESYEFLVKGNLDDHWAKWFGGLAVTHTAEGETLIRGPIRDQAELYGVINKLRDLGLVLVAVHRAGESPRL